MRIVKYNRNSPGREAYLRNLAQTFKSAQGQLILVEILTRFEYAADARNDAEYTAKINIARELMSDLAEADLELCTRVHNLAMRWSD